MYSLVISLYWITSVCPFDQQDSPLENSSSRNDQNFTNITIDPEADEKNSRITEEILHNTESEKLLAKKNNPQQLEKLYKTAERKHVFTIVVLSLFSLGGLGYSAWLIFS